MKPLVKIMLIMATVFICLLGILTFTDLMTMEKIEQWLKAGKSVSPAYVFGIVVILMVADLFLAVPTMPVMLSAGFFIGWPLGAAASALGLLLAGIIGYFISRKYGHTLLRFVEKDQQIRDEAIILFRERGAVIILLSRAVPMLPEISCCLAGMSKMPFGKFLLLWLLSMTPSALIANYAGSISTLDDPTPAIIGVGTVILLLWSSWFFVMKRGQKKKKLAIESEIQGQE